MYIQMQIDDLSLTPMTEAAQTSVFSVQSPGNRFVLQSSRCRSTDALLAATWSENACHKCTGLSSLTHFKCFTHSRSRLMIYTSFTRFYMYQQSVQNCMEHIQFCTKCSCLRVKLERIDLWSIGCVSKSMEMNVMPSALSQIRTNKDIQVRKQPEISSGSRNMR